MDRLDAAEEPDPASEQETVPAPTMYARAYQLEMFQLSMQGNIIVTDPAKRICENPTPAASRGRQVLLDRIYKLTRLCSAKLRIEAELERTPLKKVWYLAPSVALADQQHRYLSTQLPYHNFRLITGLDNVQFWSTQNVWDSVLKDINVVVSTPQVLLDALTHAFVFLQSLSLLVFDEAHHCIAKSPMANIMRMFYHPLRTQTHTYKPPHILGLTASPITNKVSTLRELEINMNATCKSPTMHIEDLKQYVHVPTLDKITYDASVQSRSAVLADLRVIVDCLRIEDEPIVKHLRKSDSPASMAKLAKIYRRGYTKTMQQCRSFLGNAEEIEASLGIWAAKLYVDTCIAKLQAVVKARESVVFDLPEEDVRYVEEKLQSIIARSDFNVQSIPSRPDMAQKVRLVIDYLVRYCRPGLSAIIFVKRRSTAFILTQLMTRYSSTAPLGIFAFVGNTSHSSRGLGDLADMQFQNEAFADFRAGRRNVCVATSVMEEGIDVQATNLVIRFDEPDSLRAFIQSRGRARQPDSRIAMVQAAGENSTKLYQWADLEAEMEAQYLAIDRAIAVESANEDEDKLCGEYYQVGNTGAVLTYENARSHLEHFCNTLQHADNTQPSQPIILVAGNTGEFMSAQINLPSSIAPSLQITNSLRTWRSEKAAIKDAAFQCYRKLHLAGVVNDNLLPFHLDTTDQEEAQTRDSTYQVREAANPWLRTSESKFYAHRVEIFNQDRTFPPLLLILPHRIDHTVQFPLQSTPYGTLEAKINIGVEKCNIDYILSSRITSTLFSLILGRRLKGVDVDKMSKLPYLLIPDIPGIDLQNWVDKMMTPPDLLSSRVFNDSLQNQKYLLRYQSEEILYLWSPFFENFHVRRYTDGETVLAQRLTKQLHFLDAAPLPYQADCRQLKAGLCFVEALPAAYGEVMVLMPSILYMVELALRGQLVVQQGPLRQIGFTDSKLVSKALVASSASSSFNYDRLEFLGDALLKFYASVQVFFEFPLLPEGALTIKRRNLVANARLQKATRDLGLDAYLTTDAFSGQAWTLEITTSEHEQRDISSKTLADVVESLLGAAFLDSRHVYGQRDLVVSTLNTILSDTKWRAPSEHIQNSRGAGMGSKVNTAAASFVESMLCYRFNNKLLLAEALTKSSLREGAMSYQRLEFIGDAILDYIVGTALYRSHARDPAEMTLYRHALVNHHLLGFLGLGMSRTVGVKQVTSMREGVSISNISKAVRLVDHVAILPDRAQSEQRERAESTYLVVSSEVQHMLSVGNGIPWTLIRSIDTSKLYSDVVESVLGAVFIDSGGSISACEKVLDVFGLTKIMDRTLCERNFDSMFSIHKLQQSYNSVCIKHKTSGQISKGTKKWTYGISLDGEEISKYTSSVSAAHAENAAADLAMEVLALRKANAAM